MMTCGVLAPTEVAPRSGRATLFPVHVLDDLFVSNRGLGGLADVRDDDLDVDDELVLDKLVDELLSEEIAVCHPVRMEVLAGSRDESHLVTLRRLLTRATVSANYRSRL